MAENGENEQEELNFSEDVGDVDNDTFGEDTPAVEAEREATEVGDGDGDTSAHAEVDDPVSIKFQAY